MSVFADAKVMLANGIAAPALGNIRQPCMMHVVEMILAIQVLNPGKINLKN